MFLTELTLSYSVRIEVEKAFAHYVVTKNIEINSEAYREIQLADIIPSLRKMHGRWNFVGPDDVNCSSQPAMRSLGKLLSALKRNTTKVPDLIRTEKEI